MPAVKFDWDSNKAAANEQKHGVSFAEAQEVFLDPNALDRFDADHSIIELRYNIIGLSSRRLLFVVYTEGADDVIRLVSARKATRRDQTEYEQAN
jgi:uncharacterized protein